MLRTESDTKIEEIKTNLSKKVFIVLQEIREAKKVFEKPEPFESDFDFLYERDEESANAHKYLESSITKMETLLEEIK